MNLRLTLSAALIVFLAGCNNTPAPPPAESKTPTPVQAESILAGIPIEKTRTFTSAARKTSYKIETVHDDHEAEMRARPEAERDVSAAAAGGDKFQGTARKAAKISLASAAMESFADVQALIATLPGHSAMVNHVPPIKKTAASNRVDEEKRNVKVAAFLYAASREDDNDFHLIIGRAPTASPAVYMTVELSGLPPANAASFAKLKAARDAFKDFFGSDLPGSSYDFYSPPIPVEIEGSLFFDMSHATGSRPGPSALRPKMPVVWEIHPISKIVFEP